MALNIPWDLFRKLLCNDISEADHKLLMVWRDKSRLNRYIYDEILDDTEIQQFLIAEKSIDHSGEWNKLLAKIKPAQSKVVIKTRTFYIASSVAATLLLLIGISAGIWFFGKKATKDVSEYTYVFSPRGQRTQMVLPDKSRVWLNSETSIRYTTDFNQEVREVYIEGEAYFQVTKNPEKPFVVKTSDLKIKVYGTSFNVKAYPEEKVIETTLIEGKLSVIPNETQSASSGEIYLKPKDRLTYTKANSELSLSSQKEPEREEEHARPVHVNPVPKVILAKNVDAKIEQSWKDGTLLFKDELFSDLAIRLERWYNIKIHFGDERIKTYRFTGKFDKETINEAMEALRASSQASYRYEIVFRDVYLRSK